jgi:hypothetical protein
MHVAARAMESRNSSKLIENLILGSSEEDSFHRAYQDRQQSNSFEQEDENSLPSRNSRKGKGKPTSDVDIDGKKGWRLNDSVRTFDGGMGKKLDLDEGDETFQEGEDEEVTIRRVEGDEDETIGMRDGEMDEEEKRIRKLKEERDALRMLNRMIEGWIEDAKKVNQNMEVSRIDILW